MKNMLVSQLESFGYLQNFAYYHMRKPDEEMGFDFFDFHRKICCPCDAEFW